jgi:hypothetical protein
LGGDVLQADATNPDANAEQDFRAKQILTIIKYSALDKIPVNYMQLDPQMARCIFFAGRKAVKRLGLKEGTHR